MKDGSLQDLIKLRSLDRYEILRISLDVARGLNYLHSLSPKVIHRDLKSANVLVWHVGF